MLNHFLFQKTCRLQDNVDRYGRARQAADDNVIRIMRFLGWITTATDTHSEYVIRIGFHIKKWLRKRASVLSLYVHYRIVSYER
jgi:hypothetical protein